MEKTELSVFLVNSNSLFARFLGSDDKLSFGFFNIKIMRARICDVFKWEMVLAYNKNLDIRLLKLYPRLPL